MSINNGYRSCGTYIHNGILLSHEKATWVDLEIILLSGGNIEKRRWISYGVTYIWNPKYDKNAIYKIETESQIKQNKTKLMKLTEVERVGEG